MAVVRLLRMARPPHPSRNLRYTLRSLPPTVKHDDRQVSEQGDRQGMAPDSFSDPMRSQSKPSSSSTSSVC